MELVEIRSGLWRWTAAHPEWEAGQPRDSPGDWPEEVGCVAYRAPGAFVLIDPLVTDDDWHGFDTLVESHGEPVHVLLTIGWHERSRADALARYGGSEEVPPGVEAIPIPRAGETLFWIPEHGALVPGDRILGFGGGEGGLRLCPDSWLRYLDSGITGTELRLQLLRILDLPVEVVLVSHGEPVLETGRDALESALHEGAPSG